jgi:hypothetical protein
VSTLSETRCEWNAACSTHVAKTHTRIYFLLLDFFLCLLYVSTVFVDIIGAFTTFELFRISLRIKNAVWHHITSKLISCSSLFASTSS